MTDERLRALLFKGTLDDELDEELRYHLECEVEQNVRAGMSPEEARLAALRAFGAVERVKEECREARGVRFIEDLWQDIRYGVRTLRKRPGFTLVAVLTLALGVGANSAIFSVVNTVLLRPLPYADPDRLVMVWEDNTQQGFPRNSLPPANFVDYREQNQVFEAMAALTKRSFNLTGAGEPERLDGLRVSASLFPTLGARPQLGRVFSPEEDQPGAGHVVILSNRLWQRRFNSDPGIVGETVTLDGEGYTAVGVMPPDFQLRAGLAGAEDELWVPLAFGPREVSSRGSHYLNVVARLKPGVTLEQARAGMNTVARRLQQQYPDYNAGIGAAVVSETMARRYWPGEDPLGKRLAPGSAESHDDWITVVGVVNDVRQFELDADPRRLCASRPMTSSCGRFSRDSARYCMATLRANTREGKRPATPHPI